MVLNRAGVFGAVFAGVTLIALVLLDLATPGETVSMAPLFALSPLIACAVLPAAPTAGFAIAAFLSAVASGLWNHNFEAPQQILRLVDVALVSAVAVVVAAVRVRREGHLGRITTIAEVAQRAVLPVLPAHARRVDTAVRYVSAAQDAVIGGDLYDCYHSRTHTRFLIGDVRGKGIGAVEQAARVIRAFRQAAAIQSGLAAVAEDMSGYLTSFFDDEEFVTALLVDTTDPGRLTLVSAGHLPPMLIRPDGTAELLVDSASGLPLGLGHLYASHTVSWQPGDRLLLYTDGLSEARDADGEFLDLLTLGPLLAEQPLDGALDRLLDAVVGHVVDGELGDDLAVVLLEHTAGTKEYRPVEGEHDWRTSLAR
jgi:serine phosphatase RsbU (regulator of sigma subunit)